MFRALIREYVWLDDLPVAVLEGGQVYYVRADHIGRPVLATTSAGTVVWTARYLPFGEVRVTTGAPIGLRFPGQWYQAESGLHQNWMRDYDPTTGRYMQADPLGLVDGASVYGYVKGNVVNRVDPTGLRDKSGTRKAGSVCNYSSVPIVVFNIDKKSHKIILPGTCTEDNTDWDSIYTGCSCELVGRSSEVTDDPAAPGAVIVDSRVDFEGYGPDWIPVSWIKPQTVPSLWNCFPAWQILGKSGPFESGDKK